VTASPGLFTGAGLSHAAPAALPLARTFHRRLHEILYAAATTFAPGLLDHGAYDTIRTGAWNVLSRLENVLPGSGAGALACLRVAVPNEAHLLAAIQLAHGGLHVTVNVDDGVERAYALLSGATQLPAETPAHYHAALLRWRSCFPDAAPALRVLTTPADFRSASFSTRPLLVKLHGSAGGCRDGVVLAVPPVTDDVDVTALGRHRTAALDALAEEFIVVTGYSGSDFASFTALLARLRPGRFWWIAPVIRTDVRTALRAVDPGQPLKGRAVAALRAHLRLTPPEWPTERVEIPSFDERLGAWSSQLPPRAAAEAVAWALADAGWGREAVAILERVCANSDDVGTRVRLAHALAHRAGPGDAASSARTFLRAAARSADPALTAYALTRWAECRAEVEAPAAGRRVRAAARVAASAAVIAGGRRASPSDRVRATSAVMGLLLSRLERRLAAAIPSQGRRLALKAAADGAAAEVSRALAATAHLPSGKRRALLERQAIELDAIAALLGGLPPGAEALRSLRHLCRTYEHLADPRGLAEAIATRALVLLAAGQPSRALLAFQEASRLHPASVGVLGAVRDLLDRSSDASHSMGSIAGRNGSGRGRSQASANGRRSDALEAFARALPKVELHVHLEGSVAPSTLAALARRNRDRRVPWTADGVRRWYRFRSYTDFLNAYVLVCDQLQTAEDFARVTVELGETLARQGARYAEVTFSPVAHVRRGIAPEELFAGLESGRGQTKASHGVRIEWCAACGTRRGPAAGMETIEMVLTHRPPGVVSLGLAGLESAVPRAQFAPAFAIAREAGLHRVVHAGEALGPASVWGALDVLGAERIGHGIRSLEDPALVERLRRTATPLEVCPTSNVRTGVVATLRTHPLPRLLAKGLVVTLNTDDPAMFHTDLTAEYFNAARVFGVGAAGLADVARAGVRSAFLARDDAEALLAKIDSVPVPDELLSPETVR
jgi:aminodeoxyfutalosine deaminase